MEPNKESKMNDVVVVTMTNLVTLSKEHNNKIIFNNFEIITAVNEEIVQGSQASSLVVFGDANCVPNITPAIGDENRAPKAADAPHIK